MQPPEKSWRIPYSAEAIDPTASVTPLLPDRGGSTPLYDRGRSATFRQNVARFRLYRHRSLQENTRFSAFFKIYQIIKLKFLKFGKILQILQVIWQNLKFLSNFKMLI